MITSAIILGIYIIIIVMFIPELHKQVLLKKIQVMKSWTNNISFKKIQTIPYLLKNRVYNRFSAKDSVI